MLIRNAAAIMTGLPGAAARAPGGDLRIDQEGRISAIGRLEKEPGERVITQGVGNLRQGAAIRPVPASSAQRVGAPQGGGAEAKGK